MTKMINNEKKQLYLKRLYNDALCFHLLHKGYKIEQAELEVAKLMKN